MTDKHNTLLSPYQSAILQELGISQWQLTESAVVSQDPTQANLKVPAEESPVIAAKVELIAIPEQVLLLMSVDEVNSPVVRDILLSLNLDQHEQVLAERDALNQYCDYQFAWLFSDNAEQGSLQWQDNCLTTPPLEQLHASDIKKQLWASLQKQHDNTVC